MKYKSIVVLVAITSVQALAKMTPSDMSMAMFRSARIKEPTVFKAKVAIAPWDSVYYEERGPVEDFRNQFLAVRVQPYNARMEQSAARHFCFVKKSSEAGNVVASALRDGGIHAALVSLRYSDKPDYEGVCVLDEIEMLEYGEATDISVKFTSTRISVVKGKDRDILQGKISARISTSKKFFNRPVLRVVVLSEENGSLVIRDSIMDEPNIKVIGVSDTVSRYTTTEGNDQNEPPPYERFIEEISKNQSEVSKEVFSTVTYNGLPLGLREKRTISGAKIVHEFGYAMFDRDENAKLLGYRLEMWYRGSCLAVYDTIKPAQIKKLQLPDDWHVSFSYPDKFKYRSPFSKKAAVRY